MNLTRDEANQLKQCLTSIRETLPIVKTHPEKASRRLARALISLPLVLREDYIKNVAASLVEDTKRHMGTFPHLDDVGGLAKWCGHARALLHQADGVPLSMQSDDLKRATASIRLALNKAKPALDRATNSP